MSFRVRLTFVAAAAVALAVVLSSVVVYVVVRDQLRSEVDRALEARAVQIQHIPLGRRFPDVPDPIFGGAPGYVQVVRDDGSVLRPPGADVPIPVTQHVLEVASGTEQPFFTDATLVDTHVRVLTFPYLPGVALQVARPLTEVDSTLDRLRAFLILIALAGIGLAAALGLIVSRAAIAPVARLTRATERVAETGDLTERIDARGQDELSRLAGSFNAMLGALEESTKAQRQLVADASHELRTPLTSLRTNFEVLMSDRELAPDERRQLLDDVVEQIGEMTTLIAELIELARGDQLPSEPEDVRLDLVAEEAVERVRRDRPGVTFKTDLRESVVRGVPSSLERAIGNVLDNAAKWSPPGGDVDVSVDDGTVTVRDRGPGIDDADMPYVFDRFYRSPSARTMPGSGLGLAIVRQVAEAHGGDVVAERAEGGGTRVTLRLNGGVSNS
ncbi:MAG TPA: HAMP domain-containing sensor histidine kinase [Gaiellaceae bacterium]|nr:HAMP domain-containing sensor histidine kinase [Gaiellaceae bacterium]